MLGSFKTHACTPYVNNLTKQTGSGYMLTTHVQMPIFV